MKKKKFNENKTFHKWWDESGYKYKPESDEEKDWYNIVMYWAWKGWEARALTYSPVCNRRARK